jgi:hypothetical protein
VDVRNFVKANCLDTKELSCLNHTFELGDGEVEPPTKEFQRGQFCVGVA